MWLTRLLPVVMILLIPLNIQAQSPLIEVQKVAVQDTRRIAPGAGIYTRYLSLSTIPQKDRVEFLKVLSFHCNMLSREAEFGRLRLVTPDASVVALNIRDYGWDTKTYERLAEVDYTYHARITSISEEKVEIVNEVVYQPTGRKISRDGGRTYENEVVRVEKKVEKKVPGAKKTVTAQAPWLDPLLSAELVTVLQTQAPILDAQWFMIQTAIQRGNEVGYYDFLDLGKKEADFQKLIGADPVLSRRFRKEIAGVLGRSGVAINNRRVVRFQGLGGGYWITDDFKTSKGKQNVLNFLDGDTEPPTGDASEQYGVLPNGLFAFYLINDKGERQDFVPAETIASDNHTISNDKKIYSGKSCIACHVEGIRPIDDYARRMFRNAIQLQSVDYDKYVRLRQLYLSDLKKQIGRDITVYSEALVELNGQDWTPAKNAKSYERYWDNYYEEDWGRERIALSLGTTKEILLKSLKMRASPPPLGIGNLENVLACLIQEPEIPLRVEYVEDNYALLQLILVDHRYQAK